MTSRRLQMRHLLFMNFFRIARPRLCTPHNIRLISLSASRYTASTHQPIKTCPSCSTPLPSFLPACPKCSNIFALAPQTTHHDIFGLPYDPNPFNVDVVMLKRRFREAQAVCHPDSWASKGSVRSVSFVVSTAPHPIGLKDKRDAAQALSSLVNNAYQTLLHPLSRAEYILARNQMSVSESDQVDDLEFMAEIMESREIIEDADEPDEVTRVISENKGPCLIFFSTEESFISFVFLYRKNTSTDSRVRQVGRKTRMEGDESCCCTAEILGRYR